MTPKNDSADPRPQKIWLANVGANAAHPFYSPRFDDGTFELLPIPETPTEAGPHSVRYADVPSFQHPGETLGRWVPERFRDTATHYDPEFQTLTYGDNVERNARAAGLRGVESGDVLFFIVRLADWIDGEFSGRFGFYLAGFLEIESILAGVEEHPTQAEMARYGVNAHIRRGLNDPSQHWDRFWIFGGSERSKRLTHAVPVDRVLADGVFRRADGGLWNWNPSRTELQTIGSYTRTCRCVIDVSEPGGPERADLLWEAVEKLNPGIRHAPHS
ncbi:MAG: hypothetical protein HOC77_06035 [Chloroflexi bacterium]|nr:hypothetical protein [Chloroflexota bacterium]MBT4073551.1 hypothetical protein [Chloroflexota bacterium]MBT4514634.1 hypothetical protein [Chloroflexota bacterium]MBT5320378.1 hypothetical protein [Chloroflexota bacterium]MBT6681114.1 hypothetical protein [Chloroflexota bacterium]